MPACDLRPAETRPPAVDAAIDSGMTPGAGNAFAQDMLPTMPEEAPTTLGLAGVPAPTPAASPPTPQPPPSAPPAGPGPAAPHGPAGAQADAPAPAPAQAAAPPASATLTVPTTREEALALHARASE